MKSRKAFVLAAGFGKRMGTYTQNTPKPLLEIEGKTLLDACLERAFQWGVTEVICNTHYLGEKIHSHLKDFSLFPIYVSHEFPNILGTAGGIRTALDSNCFLANPLCFPHLPQFKIPLVSSEHSWSWDDEILLMNPDTVLFVQNGFFPRKLPQGSVADLYIQSYPEGAQYTKLFWNSKDQSLRFAKETNDGSLNFLESVYYIGLSKISLSILKNVPWNQGSELGNVFKNLGDMRMLTGYPFKGEAIDIGEKEFYEKILEINKFSPSKSFWK